MTLELKTQQFKADRLKELAKDRRNVVYEFTHDQPEAFLSPERQATLLRDIIFGFDKACRDFKDWSVEHLREHVLSRHPETRVFQRLYPLVFASVTVRATTPDMVSRLDKVRKLSMLFIMERWKGEGDEGEKHARAMYTAMRVSMRERRATDVGAEAPEGVAMTPMDASEMGECTVHQD